MSALIYAIHNDKNHLVYIGSTTKDISTLRVKPQVPGLVETKLLDDLRQFGVGHFRIELLEETAVDNLQSRYHEIISSYDASKLYNVRPSPVNYNKLNEIIEKHKDDLQSVAWTINKDS